MLASHDTARLITIANGDITSVELATLLLLTFPGSPSIYYGDEVGLRGGLDPDCRRSFPLETNWNLQILETHKKLISLRHKYPALRVGTYQVIYAEETLYVFLRTWKTEELIITVNVGDDSVIANFDIANLQIKLQNKPQNLLFGCIFG